MRKGQVFIVGALIFASLLLSIVVVVQGGELFYSGGNAPSKFFDRSVAEFPAAANNALADNSSVYSVRRDVHSFMEFQVYTGRSRGMETRAHALVLVPNSTGVRAVVLNFRGSGPAEASLSVEGETRSLVMDSGTSRVVHFGSVPETFDVDFGLESGESFDHSFTASRKRMTALQSLSVSSESQTWVDTRIY